MSMKRLAVVASLGLVLGSVDFAQGQQSALLGRVRGRVLDAEGKGIAGVRIEMTLDGARPKKYLLTTDKKGGYIRVGIDEGTYRLTFSHNGYEPISTSVSVSLGGVSEIPPVKMKPQSGPAAGASAPGTPAVTLAADAFAKLKGDFDKANEALKAGDLDAAETLFKALVAAQPRVPEFHYNLGVVYEQKKDLANAAVEYRSAAELDPSRSDSYAALVNVLLLNRQRDEAVKVIADAVARFPQDGRLQFTMGVRYFELGRAQEAQAVLQKVRELEPANPEPLYYLGVLALQKGLAPEALAELQKYVGLTGQDPRNLQLARNLIAELKKAH